MKPELRHVGRGRHPVVVVDGLTGAAADIRELAAALTPFPPAGNYYPGVRRLLSPEDGPAYDYVERLLRAAAPFIGGGFHHNAFDLVEASFSMVTAAPDTLKPGQCAPHFDAVDPYHLAVMHYLSDIPGAGTAFYRQRATGIEAVEPGTVDAFVAETTRTGSAGEGYITGSNDAYEEIGRVEGVADRLVIYQGRLLHSGIIPADMNFSADPRVGRLTANIFIQGR